MIATSYEEVHSEEWVRQNILDSNNELVICRKLIPWNKMIKGLSLFYNGKKGAFGKNIRMMVGILLVMNLRDLSDRGVLKQIQENRYIQYFCNIPDEELKTCIDHSTICKCRKRFGEKGVKFIENEIFKHLNRAKAIANDMSLIDSTVLANNVIHPNDVRLVFFALKGMIRWALKYDVPLGVTHKEVKQLWNTYHKNRKNNRLEHLGYFYELFTPAMAQFKILSKKKDLPPLAILQAESLTEVFEILDKQTQQKLDGEIHIKDRLVSIKELDARPIKKGKSFPECEFGTSMQMCFNRQGFMISCETFIGTPEDKTYYASILDDYIQRMNGAPKAAVTDGNYRTVTNLKAHSDEIESIFMGRTSDVQKQNLEDCLSARAATEGFIAVSKNLRRFGKSLYLGLQGDKIWTTLSQAAYNLKKFLQLYEEEDYDESVLIALGVWQA